MSWFVSDRISAATSDTHQPHRHRRLVTGFVAALLTIQVGFAINGYRDPHKFFAFQPFHESSTWRADIVRVTWDGERLPVEGGWAGYDWNELVDTAALQHPWRTRHAYIGGRRHYRLPRSGSRLIAANTPDDLDTRFLEATVTSFENTRGPTVTVVRSAERSLS